MNHKGQLIGICETLVGENLALMRVERKYATAVNSLGSGVRQTQGGELGLHFLHVTSLSLCVSLYKMGTIMEASLLHCGEDSTR